MDGRILSIVFLGYIAFSKPLPFETKVVINEQIQTEIHTKEN